MGDSLRYPLVLTEGVATLYEIVHCEPFVDWQSRAAAGAEQGI